MSSKNYDLNGVSGNVELGKRGPRIKDNAGVIEHRNQADDAYVRVKGDHPIDDNDLVTKHYLETRADVRVTGQVNGTSAPAVPPAGTIYICTTAGTDGRTWNEGYLYRSDGSSWATSEEIVPVEGLRIVVTDDLTGGNIEFLGDHVYIWDADGSTWVDLGPAPDVESVVKTARLPFGFADTGVNLLDSLPAGSIVTAAQIDVQVVWDDALPGARVGISGTDDLFMEEKDSDLAKVGLYKVNIHHLFGSATPVNLTLNNNAGTPTQGSAVLLVQYDIL